MIHRLSLLVLSLSTLTLAAQPKVQFSESEMNLGNIQWHTQAVANIRLKNVGNQPLYITDVNSDCSCTIVDWDHSAIAPGGSSTITVTYDAETLGTFGRNIAISTNASAEPNYILLSGRVQTEVHDYSAEFPYKVDHVFLSTDVLEFDDVNLGEMPQATIYVYNNSQKTYSPEFMHLPKWLSMVSTPEELRPGRIGKVTFTLDSRQLPVMGLTQASIYVARYPGDKVRKAGEVSVSATLLPQFTDNGLQQYGKAVIPTKIVLGKGLGTKKLRGSLTLENQGTGTLTVSTLQVYNPGLSVSLSKSVLKPGERATLKIKASASTDNFKGRRRVLLITDDPQNPKITIDVTKE